MHLRLIRTGFCGQDLQQALPKEKQDQLKLYGKMALVEKTMSQTDVSTSLLIQEGVAIDYESEQGAGCSDHVSN